MPGSILRSLNVKSAGEGTDTLVLAHGFGTDQNAWSALVPLLSRHYRVVTYDLASAGSVNPAFFDLRRHGELAGHAEDLLSILDALSVPRCTFTGHSVSGMIGLLAARREPARFDKLVMLGASPHYLNDGDYRGGFERGDIGLVFDAIAANLRDWARSTCSVMMDRPPDDPSTRSFEASVVAMRPDVALATAKAIFMSDLRPLLPQVSTPVALLQTRIDPAVPLAVAEYLHRHLPVSTLDLIDATGHLPHVSAPSVVADALRRHLDGLPQAV